MSWVRNQRPGSIQNLLQEAFLLDFAESCRVPVTAQEQFVEGPRKFCNKYEKDMPCAFESITR